MIKKEAKEILEKGYIVNGSELWLGKTKILDIEFIPIPKHIIDIIKIINPECGRILENSIYK